jgi:hypothetical protein
MVERITLCIQQQNVQTNVGTFKVLGKFKLRLYALANVVFLSPT